MAKRTQKNTKKSKSQKPKPQKSVSSHDTDLIGRESELRKVMVCIDSSRSVLLEGPVGVGKTHLALAATRARGRPVFRIDGDSRYTEQKLTGWFDPPAVMKRGFTRDAFIEGPLVAAMKAGGILFINELNRLPEGVQNVLLPALDEKMVAIPKLGTIFALPEFMVIATQNPKEFVATSHLSEAILDRFELISIDYQSEVEEYEVVHSRLQAKIDIESGGDLIAKASIRLTRATRNHPKIRRGASIRAGLALAELTAMFMKDGADFREAFLEAALMALPTRIEIDQDTSSGRSLQAETESILTEIADEAISNLDSPLAEKKKS